jgi:hypothetical protein
MSGVLLGAVGALAIGWGALAPVTAAPVSPAVAVSCAEDVAACDSDGDGIVDLVEEATCGSATCATGAEDRDDDGVADVEQLSGSLEQGGPGGPVRASDPGWVRLVLPGPVVVDVPWWPVAVAAVGGVVVGTVVTARRRAARHSSGARQAIGGRVG